MYMDSSIVGILYKSPKYGSYKLTGIRIGYNKYEIEFINTGYKYIAQIGDIRKGLVRDYLAKTIAGVGFIGRKSASKGRFYAAWCSMLHRCYDKHHKEYPRYGARGATVCIEWHNYCNFERDIVKVDGYNKDLYNEKLISLDKDKKGKNYYSLDSCCFLSSAEQQIYSRNTKEFSATKDSKIYIAGSIRAFAKEHNIYRPSIMKCLKGNLESHKGWTFKYIN